MGTEVSTSGDVYSYGILLLEMFTGKRPTDEMFSDGLNLHNYVKMALPERVEVIADPILIQQGEEEQSLMSSGAIFLEWVEYMEGEEIQLMFNHELVQHIDGSF
ncbi:hypothetical protein F0562_027994 [Nyssa sinensis]|uniref:Serine-threonine/tyrosine-protein kinase catalytic domain-containing protein n=1 Tax=Nyssa sinensis TaxID=561372 RepID=A0A5J5B7K4_9ASTE|nr:hypothetical protein F0562_027994 [Nyssa sinensis]